MLILAVTVLPCDTGKLEHRHIGILTGIPRYWHTWHTWLAFNHREDEKFTPEHNVSETFARTLGGTSYDFIAQSNMTLDVATAVINAEGRDMVQVSDEKRTSKIIRNTYALANACGDTVSFDSKNHEWERYVKNLGVTPKWRMQIAKRERELARLMAAQGQADQRAPKSKAKGKGKAKLVTAGDDDEPLDLPPIKYDKIKLPQCTNGFFYNPHQILTAMEGSEKLDSGLRSCLLCNDVGTGKTIYGRLDDAASLSCRQREVRQQEMGYSFGSQHVCCSGKLGGPDL